MPTCYLGTKFSVVHDVEADLKAGKVTELPMHEAMYASIPKPQLQELSARTGLWYTTGEMDLTPSHTLNQDFPDIRPVSVKEFLEQAWKGS